MAVIVLNLAPEKDNRSPSNTKIINYVNSYLYYMFLCMAGSGIEEWFKHQITQSNLLLGNGALYSSDSSDFLFIENLINFTYNQTNVKS